MINARIYLENCQQWVNLCFSLISFEVPTLRICSKRYIFLLPENIRTVLLRAMEMQHWEQIGLCQLTKSTILFSANLTQKQPVLVVMQYVHLKFLEKAICLLQFEIIGVSKVM